MISFRVSEREFEMLKTLSESEGARSVSDFARLALCGPGNGHGPPSGPADLTQLRSKLEELKADVQRVAELIEHQTRRPRGAPLPRAQNGRGTESGS
jgi:hypothetical protein